MNFIEQVFGIVPDGGSGALEMVIFAITLVGMCYYVLPRLRRDARHQ
jgi:hypothetical protein